MNGTDGYPHARSEMYTPAEREGAPPAYRCNYVGEYAWTPQAKQESSSWERFGTQEQIYECLRSAKARKEGGQRFMYASLCRLLNILTLLLTHHFPRRQPAASKNNFTRIVMYGDSHSRTTLNGFLNLVRRRRWHRRWTTPLHTRLD